MSGSAERSRSRRRDRASYAWTSTVDGRTDAERECGSDRHDEMSRLTKKGARCLRVEIAVEIMLRHERGEDADVARTRLDTSFIVSDGKCCRASRVTWYAPGGTEFRERRVSLDAPRSSSPRRSATCMRMGHGTVRRLEVNPAKASQYSMRNATSHASGIGSDVDLVNALATCTPWHRRRYRHPRTGPSEFAAV